MKKNILYLVLALSLIANIFFISYYVREKIALKAATEEKAKQDFSNVEYRDNKAKATVRKLVCDKLYYPSSYDPVSTKVDSCFYNYMTDIRCISLAQDILNLQESYNYAKKEFDRNDETIRFHGNMGGSFLANERKKRADASKEMESLKEQMMEKAKLIKDRDTSRDGEFIGWQVIHRYRASDKDGNVSFGDVLYILNPEMDDMILRYMLDEDYKVNLTSIRNVIEYALSLDDEK